MKNIFIILFIFLLTGCGYTSVYKGINNQDISIEIKGMTGNEEINDLIDKELQVYKDKKDMRKYQIYVDTTYIKSELTKDSSGKVSSYLLQLIVNVDVVYDGKENSFSLEKQINTEPSSDTFKQNIFESNIKRNFVSSIKEDLIFKLSTLQ